MEKSAVSIETTLEAPRIRTLSEQVAAQIAAGEVVERPASVLKELLENALDAGASKLEIEVHGAGRKSIRVVDDGCGMVPEDCAAAFGRHATSKLQELAQLEDLSTMGFRGEALYAIGAVSEVTLVSCTGQGKGWKVEFAGGKLLGESEFAPVKGTSIEIRNLFYNTPARLAFLKTDAIERARMVRVVEEVALARPALSVTLRVEGKLALRLGPCEGEGALETRVGEALGVGLAEGLIPVKAERPEGKLWGLVSSPDALVGGRSSQYFFVNGRPVSSRILQQALYKAYEGRSDRKHPACVLFLEVPGESVDVNVHPQKLEVRFKSEGLLWELMTASLGKAITLAQTPTPLSSSAPPPLRGGWNPKLKTLLRMPGAELKEPGAFYKPEAPRTEAPTQEASAAQTVQPEPFDSAQGQSPVVQPELNGSETEVLGGAQAKDPAWYTPPFRFLGQIEESYLVFDAAGGLLLVDQHAAAERVRYEQYLAEASKGRPSAQRLVLPLEVELSPSQFQNILGLSEDLAFSGFANEVFGEKTLLIHSLPDAFPLGGDDVRELLAKLGDSQDLAQAGEDVLHERIATLACKKSVKAHERLGERAALQLLEDLKLCKAPVCPHGRPALVSMERGELARKFKRPGAVPQE